MLFRSVEPSEPVRLNTFDGRAVYRFGAGRGQRIVYADTGDEQTEVSREVIDRIASRWTGQPAGAATVEPVDDVDQWTIQIGMPNVGPLLKYSWPNGAEVYVSQASGEVVQSTTTASRWGAYLGAIPHWLYFTPLRKNGPRWSQVVIWSSGIGTLSAILGVVLAASVYSPSKRYRRAGVPTAIPYRGWKRWHTLFGLIFGVGAVTWAFSGMLSMDPLPVQRTGGPSAGGGPPEWSSGIPRALRDRVWPLNLFAAKHPREALAQLRGFSVKELEPISFAGEPAYLATLAGGDTRIVPLDGEPRLEFDRRTIDAVLTSAAGPDGLDELRVLDRYDRYYLDRRRERPLPVILARARDLGHTRYYIDPKTARIVGSYSARGWISRWLYHGLHSLDFPWLYDYRPAWDIVVITFMVGGTALSLTSLLLAWRVLGRTLRSLFAGSRPFAGSAGADDIDIER